jgi:hypothetical protein
MFAVEQFPMFAGELPILPEILLKILKIPIDFWLDP